MTAGAVGKSQSKAGRRPGRIIERPRLIKRLDGTEAPVILLVGPAGYGKTTLARQWARTLTGVIWVASTPSHRDVVVFSEDVAAGVDALGGTASRFIGEYMRARSNPQRAAREIAGVLAQRVQDAPVQWLVIDDYHELAVSPEVDEMVAILRERVTARMLIASRVRPSWATTKDVVYGEIEEIGPAELALTPEETTQVLGRRPDLEPLIRQAQGWPAVLALAANLDPGASREGRVPTTLHRYVAEELFTSATEELRDDLISLALLPNLEAATLSARFNVLAEAVVERARNLGFITGDGRVELHPLLGDFLLAKLAEDPEASGRIRNAIDLALATAAWEKALDLVLRFDLRDLLDLVLQGAYKPLVRSGRLGTLSSFADQTRRVPGFPPAAVDVVEAEVALRDGQYALGVDLSRRAQVGLGPNHPLSSRAHTIEGQCHNFQSRFENACAAFLQARATAVDEADEAEAIHGLAVAECYGELGNPQVHVDALAERRHRSPFHLLRYTTAALVSRRYQQGLKGDLGLWEPLHALSQVEDPRTRTSFTYTAANALALRADYREATRFLELFSSDCREYGLEFAAPFVSWTAACISLGTRRFGEADRHLQTIEDAAVDPQQRHHEINARILRGRLLLQTQRAEEALDHLGMEPDGLSVARAWKAEYLATRALALACLRFSAEADETAKQAAEMSTDAAARVAAAAARAVAYAANPEHESVAELLSLATSTDIWDPVLSALRASDELTLALIATDQHRHTVLRLAQRADDAVLTRRAGGRTRSRRSPEEVLSPRELEVIGLMAQGRRNREIAEALFIAESTVKVHVHHVLERLGVRTRAEAVARYERMQNRG
jgi:ATP/maltotriose-dependent transcriptional regulator MalT